LWWATATRKWGHLDCVLEALKQHGVNMLEIDLQRDAERELESPVAFNDLSADIHGIPNWDVQVVDQGERDGQNDERFDGKLSGDPLSSLGYPLHAKVG
jgi:hypothetical protein